MIIFSRNTNQALFAEFFLIAIAGFNQSVGAQISLSPFVIATRSSSYSSMRKLSQHCTRGPQFTRCPSARIRVRRIMPRIVNKSDDASTLIQHAIKERTELPHRREVTKNAINR